MKPIIPAIFATLLLLGAGAEADESLAIRGLFCKSEAQIIEAHGRLRSGLGPLAVAQMMNRGEVRCVYADRIAYVVARPLVIDEVRDGASSLTAYEGTLTGVRVGDNLRPIEPPMRIFFITPDDIKDAIVVGGA